MSGPLLSYDLDPMRTGPEHPVNAARRPTEVLSAQLSFDAAEVGEARDIAGMT